MANEITVNYGLAVSRGALKWKYPTNQLLVSMSGVHMVSNVQDFTPTVTGLNVNGATFSPGYAAFTNLGLTATGITGTGAATAYLEIGIMQSGAFRPFNTLNSGQIAIGPLSTLALFAKASTGTQGLGFSILER